MGTCVQNCDGAINDIHKNMIGNCNTLPESCSNAFNKSISPVISVEAVCSFNTSLLLATFQPRDIEAAP